MARGGMKGWVGTRVALRVLGFWGEWGRELSRALCLQPPVPAPGDSRETMRVKREPRESGPLEGCCVCRGQRWGVGGKSTGGRAGAAGRAEVWSRRG